MFVNQLSPAGAANWSAVYAGDGVMSTLDDADRSAGEAETPMTRTAKAQNRTSTARRMTSSLPGRWATIYYPTQVSHLQMALD
jgi:hypothetical protein